MHKLYCHIACHKTVATDKLPNDHFTLLHNSQSLYSGLQALRLASRDHLMCMMALACSEELESVARGKG